MRRAGWLLGAACAALGGLLCGPLGCTEPVTVTEPAPQAPLAAGQARTVELRALALEVERFQQVLTLEDLRALPRATLDEVWLLDLDMTPLVRNALAWLRDAPESELSTAALNMQKLLRLSPLDVDFSATSLQSLLALSGAIGIPAAQAVADLLGISRREPVLGLDEAAAVLVAGLIASHPNAQTRPGPVDAEHPDGRWPVAPGAVPITLGDVIDEFAQMTARFGAAPMPDGREHPGFIEAAHGFTVVEDAFEMRVRVNANALPYKGIDLTDASVASVNSVGSQIEHIFDPKDPQWLVIEGLVPRPTIETLTVRVTESPAFFPVATSRLPGPYGDSPVWDADPWLLEPMVARMTRDKVLAQAAGRCVAYDIGAETQVFRGCIAEDGWITFDTFNDVGDAPDPTYLWDLETEMAQVRLHDGGIPEGQAEVEFTLHDVDLGVDARKLLEEIKNNLAADPRALRELAQATNQTTRGAADVFYVHVPTGDQAGDWLWFVEPVDIPRAQGGDRARPYSYPNPGFFADAALTRPVGGRIELGGDVDHLKVPVRPGERVFVQDDTGAVFQLDIGRKPSPRWLPVTVTRLP
ncbi:MAG: acetyltransferase [Myxococcales bacterium]|nr:acetyltransferase [Myxococcales bacterium]